MSNTTRARLDIEIFVDCPNCEYMIDLMRPDDTNNRNHNDDDGILSQACPSDGHWSDAHEEFECNGVKCSKCGHKFDVNGLDW